MSSQAIGFDIYAKDRASQVFDKVGAKVKESSGFFERHKAAMVGAAAAVGAGLVALGKSSLDAASDQNEVMSKSTVIFGKQAEAMQKWASGAATNLGLSKTAALEASSGFGDMFLQLGFAGDKAADMSKKVVQMSADLGSFNNLPTAEVAEMMSAAFRGEYDSLQRLIPNINAARVESEAMAMTGKKTTAELTAQEKAAATLAIVTKDGARANGDFARTSDSLANRQKIATAQWENLQATLGQKLLPIGQKVVQWLSDAMTWVGNNTGTVKLLVGAVGVLVTGLAGLMVLRKITAAVAMFNAALAMNPIGLVVIAIAALAAGLIYAYKNSETFRKIVDGAFKAIGAVARWLWNTIYAPFFRFLVNGFATVAEWIANMLDALGNIPGFGWAKSAAEKMRGAAGAARGLANNIRNIPDANVNVHVGLSGPGVQLLHRSQQQRNPDIYYGRASGGPVRPNVPYAVGDNPDGSWNATTELFVPDTAGRVLSASQSRAWLRGVGTPLGGGGGEVHVHVYIDGREVRHSLQRTNRQLG